MYFFSFTHEGQNAIGLKTKNGNFNFSIALDIYQQSQGTKQPIPVTFLQVLVEMEFCSNEVANEVMENAWVQAKMGELRVAPDVCMDLPIGRPGKIIGVGRNYKNHVKELDHDIPELPLFFCKATSSLIATDQPIIIPEWLDTRVDHEAELAVIISKQGRSISEADAMDYVAGFTILNDVTARDIQKEDVNSAHPWFRSKSMDTFCPVGPGITPADQDLDPHNLDIVLTVNGEIRQKNNTKNMIFTIPQIIAEISKYMTLLPGDIIATGTPEGVGPIYNGDIIEIKITGLGTLTNKVGL